jgi:hypothetical protein
VKGGTDGAKQHLLADCGIVRGNCHTFAGNTAIYSDVPFFYLYAKVAGRNQGTKMHPFYMHVWTTWFRLCEGESAIITGAKVKFAGNRAYHDNDKTLSIRESF